MTIAEIMKKMVDFSEGNTHDINHFMKVYTFAKTIGELEKLDSETQFILEAAAIIHDIACPLCRVKYGNTDGKNQERESDALVHSFFEGTGLTAPQVDRIAFLASHHHTITGVDGPDYRILLEADYLVNADESSFSEENVINAREAFFRTEAGLSLLDSIYGRIYK